MYWNTAFDNHKTPAYFSLQLKFGRREQLRVMYMLHEIFVDVLIGIDNMPKNGLHIEIMVPTISLPSPGIVVIQVSAATDADWSHSSER